METIRKHRETSGKIENNMENIWKKTGTIWKNREKTENFINKPVNCFRGAVIEPVIWNQL